MNIFFRFLIALGFSTQLLANPLRSNNYPIQYLPNPFEGSKLIQPNPAFKATSILLLHSDRGGQDQSHIAEASLLASMGFNVLAFCYFDCKPKLETNLRETLFQFEITGVMEAAAWLRAQPFSNGKVIIYGLGKGAELALIVGSQNFNFLNKPDAIIAHSPSITFSAPWNPNWDNPLCWSCIRGFNRCLQSSPMTDFEWNQQCGPDDPRDFDFTWSAFLVGGAQVKATTPIQISKFDGPLLITAGEVSATYPVAPIQELQSTLTSLNRPAQFFYFKNQSDEFDDTEELTRRQLVLDFLIRI